MRLLFRCPSQVNLCVLVLLDTADNKNLDQLFFSLQNQNYPFAVSLARKDGRKDSVIVSLQLDISCVTSHRLRHRSSFLQLNAD